jgi:2-polyprenyl-3-methyl-5-hydroxy-6-metoxy-1,4-benzoquinol methylase
MDLVDRADLPELMDSDELNIVDYNRCLRDLAAVNRVTFTHRATLNFLTRATKDLPHGTRLSVLDVAFGHGDLLRAIAGWAKRRGLEVTLTGIDLNPRSAVAARAATPQGMNIQYYTGDVFGFMPARKPDFIVTSQFTHHLTDGDIIELVRWMEKTAKKGWHIADLHRHIIAYYGFPMLTRMFGWHEIVRYDGTVSIARSFRRRDWENYLAAAGLDAEICWKLPFRYCVSRIK